VNQGFKFTDHLNSQFNPSLNFFFFFFFFYQRVTRGSFFSSESLHFPRTDYIRQNVCTWVNDFLFIYLISSNLVNNFFSYNLFSKISTNVCKRKLPCTASLKELISFSFIGK
jgi:hypothetical protein